jgi:DNA-cytosine methyltransferase
MSNDGLNVVSFFDGVGTGRLALERAGIKVKNYYAFEIDQYAMIVSKSNFPDIIQMGNVNDWKNALKDVKDVDLLMGGFPCNSYSKAGKQKGFADPRGRLIYPLVAAKEYFKPKYFFAENVEMKIELQEKLSGLIGMEPTKINSSFELAADRPRLYWSNLGKYNQTNRHKAFGDIRQRGVDVARYYYTHKAMQWIARSAIKRNKMLRIWNDGEKFQTITASHHKKYGNQRFWGILDYPNSLHKDFTDKFYISEGSKLGAVIPLNFDPNSYNLKLLNDGKRYSLTKQDSIPNRHNYLRFITVVEAARCLGFPDHYFKSVSDTQAYKCIGNSWAVPIIVNFLKNIEI